MGHILVLICLLLGRYCRKAQPVLGFSQPQQWRLLLLLPSRVTRVSQLPAGLRVGAVADPESTKSPPDHSMQGRRGHRHERFEPQ